MVDDWSGWRHAAARAFDSTRASTAAGVGAGLCAPSGRRRPVTPGSRGARRAAAVPAETSAGPTPWVSWRPAVPARRSLRGRPAHLGSPELRLETSAVWARGRVGGGERRGGRRRSALYDPGGRSQRRRRTRAARGPTPRGRSRTGHGLRGARRLDLGQEGARRRRGLRRLLPVGYGVVQRAPRPSGYFVKRPSEQHNYAVSLKELRRFEEATTLRKTMPVARRALGDSVTHAQDEVTYAYALYKADGVTRRSPRGLDHARGDARLRRLRWRAPAHSGR